MRNITSHRFALIAAVLLAGCTTTAPRPASEPSRPPASDAPPPTAAPDEGFIAMAMDESTDPEPPGGRPNVTAIGDETIALESAGYDVVYSETKRNALVVAYFLRPRSDADFVCPRPGDEAFARDERTESVVKETDYKLTGYDRGHLAPNSAIAVRFGCDAQLETFLMSNMAPQLPGLNQITWGGYEAIVDNAYATLFEGIWVLTGPVFDPTQIVTLKGKDIEIPVEFWKIVIRRKPDGEVDAAGIVMAKEERRRGVPVSTFATTIDDIESRTNIDFFPDLPPAQEAALESACPGDDWVLETEITTDFPGAPRTINEDPPEARAQPLGTQVGQPPVCAP